MKYIKTYWHFIYIMLFLVALIICIGIAYSAKINEQEVRSEISTGRLPQNEVKRNGIEILCYHRIVKNNFLTDVTKKLSNNNQMHEYSIDLVTFKQQMSFLKKHHVRIISMATAQSMIKKKHRIFTHRYAVITFDDCDQTVFENAIPILEKNKIPYTLFIITGQTNNYNRGSQMANWNEMRKLKNKSNLVTFGLHSNNLHFLVENRPVLSLPENYITFKKDLRKAQRVMQKELNVKSNLYAYPYGEATNRIQQYLTRHDFTTFSLDTGIISNTYNSNNAFPRIMVTRKTWSQEVSRWIK
ncbi:polysaccharide deacetylase [Lactiplantibacillus plantarum]|uniref:polysaccharide deacetylase family protein n=1 Tax=Lactiplantibacillus plantarum TaxID=1590 RepID=UPI0021A62063|nr:polysaccharide deacetylase family protein [Lactiplantibacillus plantarum]MCT3215997.1 polysaccharide deacetylase [Lactiplantibacillus plantarum]MCT3270410.1 polysaccharide deacetylase [Lactiplantibacillus plantarum]